MNSSSSPLICLIMKEEHRPIKSYLLLHREDCCELSTASPGACMNTCSNMRNVVSGNISLHNNLGTKHENHEHKNMTKHEKHKHLYIYRKNGVPISFNSIFEYLNNVKSFEEALIFWKHRFVKHPSVLKQNPLCMKSKKTPVNCVTWFSSFIIFILKWIKKSFPISKVILWVHHMICSYKIYKQLCQWITTLTYLPQI